MADIYRQSEQAIAEYYDEQDAVPQVAPAVGWLSQDESVSYEDRSDPFAKQIEQLVLAEVVAS